MAKKKSENNARRLARLAAVQGLYQMVLLPRPAKDIIRDFKEHPAVLLNELAEGEAMPAIDNDLFISILNGVTDNAQQLDAMIAGALDAKVSSDRIEILLRAILRSGAFELHHHGDIQAGIIINDYVDVAHAFFGASVPGLVNAVLDKLTQNLR